MKRCTSCDTTFKAFSCHNYFKTAVILKYCNTFLKWLFIVINPHSEWSSPFFLAPNDQSCATASGVIVMDRVTSNQGSNSIHREKLGQKYCAFKEERSIQSFCQYNRYTRNGSESCSLSPYWIKITDISFFSCWD